MTRKKRHLISIPRVSSTRAFFLVLPIFLVVALAVLLLTIKRNSTQELACNTSSLSGEYQKEETLAYFEGEKIPVPERTQIAFSPVLGTQEGEEKWIEVDLKNQKLIAWEGGSVYLETPVSSGLPWTPTPTGEFRIWSKFRYTKMEGGEGKYYYYLPNVPYVMFFANDQVAPMKGYGLHGTYWHNDFGTQRSHGCVNLPTPIAEKLFYWTTPVTPEGKSMVRADSQNSGTRIVIHN